MSASHLSERALCSRWTVSRRFLLELRRLRKIDYFQFGRRVVYPLAAVERYEREHTVEARSVMVPRRRTS